MKIQETENNPELFWRMIKMLLGKEKIDSEEAFIYGDKGDRQEIMECKTEFLEKWITQVYQRLEKADFSFWRDNEEGEMFKMMELMKTGNSGIMEDPIITEGEFVNTINNMKNGKASGVDNIPAEVMKALIKYNSIK